MSIKISILKFDMKTCLILSLCLMLIIIRSGDATDCYSDRGIAGEGPWLQRTCRDDKYQNSSCSVLIQGTLEGEEKWTYSCLEKKSQPKCDTKRIFLDEMEETDSTEILCCCYTKNCNDLEFVKRCLNESSGFDVAKEILVEETVRLRPKRAAMLGPPIRPVLTEFRIPTIRYGRSYRRYSRYSRYTPRYRRYSRYSRSRYRRYRRYTPSYRRYSYRSSRYGR